MIKIRQGLEMDLGMVTLMETRAKEFPLSLPGVRKFIEEDYKEILIAFIGHRAVGYALIETNKIAGVLEIKSIGVLPEFQRKGVGATLICDLRSLAVVDLINTLRIKVPSYTVEDQDDPWNVEHWLWKMEFKAVGLEPGCFRYGNEYDWYIFERELGKQNSQRRAATNCRTA
jgi:ribosomal protein S18 acetylase RimI-like enzyme